MKLHQKHTEQIYETFYQDPASLRKGDINLNYIFRSGRYTKHDCQPAHVFRKRVAQHHSIKREI